MRLVKRQAEEAGVARRYPQFALMIDQEGMQTNVGQTFSLRIADAGAVWPSAIETVRCRNPERTVTVFDDAVDITLLGIIARHSDINRDKREPHAACLKSIETLERSAPYTAIASFE